MNIFFISLFPEEMETYFLKGIFKKAFDNDIFKCFFIDLRKYSESKHRKVDDYPYGYKQGMLLKADVLAQAICSVDQYKDYQILYTCPKGERFTQKTAFELTQKKGLIIICGYYEGVDERIFELFNITKIAVGDFVLSSGELPAMMMAEAVIRLLPGVVGKDVSVKEDSILSGLLEYPQYTVPRAVLGKVVPEVLLSGHHEKIKAWQKKESFKATLFKRPSLIKQKKIKQKEKALLLEILKEE